MSEITVKELRKKLANLEDDDIIAPATGGDYEQWIEVYRMRDGSPEKLADLDEIETPMDDGTRSHGPMCPYRVGGECLCGNLGVHDEDPDQETK